MPEPYEIDFHGHLIRVVNDHASALKILAAADVRVPAIPPGCNTVSVPFTTADGARALVINQRDFERELEDDEEEVNGCLVLILGKTLGTTEQDDAVLQAFERDLEDT